MPGPDLQALEAIHAAARACSLCALHTTRTNAVPGEGSGRGGIMLVGEAPGRNEDESGRPFAGAAGRNLDAALAEAQLQRDELFVTSIVKCRPPGNRDPTPDEKHACRPFLLAQVAALSPKVLVALGRHGLSGLLPDAAGPGGARFVDLRGRFAGEYAGVPVWVSLHPAAVIYRQKWKATYLDDWRRFGAWVRSGQDAQSFQPGPPLPV